MWNSLSRVFPSRKIKKLKKENITRDEMKYAKKSEECEEIRVRKAAENWSSGQSSSVASTWTTWEGVARNRPWGLTCPITSRTCAGSPFFQIETIASFTLDPRDLLIPTRPSRRNRIFHWTNWKEPGYVSSVSLQGPIVVSHCCTTTSHSSGMKEIFSSEVNAS